MERFSLIQNPTIRNGLTAFEQNYQRSRVKRLYESAFDKPEKPPTASHKNRHLLALLLVGLSALPDIRITDISVNINTVVYKVAELYNSPACKLNWHVLHKTVDNKYSDTAIAAAFGVGFRAFEIVVRNESEVAEAEIFKDYYVRRFSGGMFREGIQIRPNARTGDINDCYYSVLERKVPKRQTGSNVR